MLKGLMLWNFAPGTHPEDVMTVGAFILKTCQRTLVLSHDVLPFKQEVLPNYELYQGEAAYLFLLETICGLKSKLIGENEIVGQFKNAYQAYSSSSQKNTKLLRILEKLFKDAKDIRTQYLIGISQKTYASITRKYLIQKAKADHVVIIGSGSLAEDLINQFKKKATISICARNSERVKELSEIHQLQILPWEMRSELINYPFLANTIGHESIIFDQTFFEEWLTKHTNRLFVDLGNPSVISTSLSLNQGVVRLIDIFDEGAVVESQKMMQIELARRAMQDVTHKRKSLFEEKLNKSSAILTPQNHSGMRYI